MLFPLYYCPGRSAGAGSPGDRDPVSKGIHQQHPTPGGGCLTALTSHFLFYAHHNPSIRTHPETIREKRASLN
jgi:hypothetical protein